MSKNSTALCEKLTRAELNEFGRILGINKSGYAIESFSKVKYKCKDYYLLTFAGFADLLHLGRISYLVDDYTCICMDPKTKSIYSNHTNEWNKFLCELKQDDQLSYND